MKVIVLIILILNLKVISQSQLGKSYIDVINYMQLDKGIYDIKEDITNTGLPYLSASFKEGKIICEVYYFNRDKSKCIAQTLGMPIEMLNFTIKKYNESYVKVSELVWKDYEQKQIITIEVLENTFLLEVKSSIN